MSFYNMIAGVSPATFFVLPMLGRHPDEYPRFRDCFLSDEKHPEYDDHIHVYTRVGGGNRGSFDEDWLYSSKGFVTTFDDSFDSTYASYVFKVPEKFKTDFELIKDGKLRETSEDYKQQVLRVFPKIKDKLQEMLYGDKEGG